MSDLQSRLQKYIGKHGKRGILLDTNVLLLLIFGQLVPEQIGRKRLASYQQEDVDLLAAYVQRFARILTTAHVLAETSNLAYQVVHGRKRDALFDALYPLFCSDAQGAFEERRVKRGAIAHDIFMKLGFTDAALVSTTRSHLLLTDDLDLYVKTQEAGGDAINFAHMREAAETV